MGWTYPYGASKKDVIEELVSGSGHNSFGGYKKDANGNEERDAEGKLIWVQTGTAKVLAHCVKGNVLWIVRVRDDLEGKRVDGWIECNLLASDKGEWGYKDMEESCGPGVSNCPLKYLDMVPCPEGGYAKEWRERVRAYWAARKILKLRDGLKLKVKPGWRTRGGMAILQVELVKQGRRWLAKINGASSLSRFPRKMLIGSEPITA